MKYILAISVVLNLGLGILVWDLIIVERRPMVAVSSPSTAATVEGTEPGIQPPAPAVMEMPSFRWKQLESPDYRAYVKNLRGIGCPESTVRAIVSGDVHAVFHKLGMEMDEQLSEINNAAWSVRLEAFHTQQNLVARRQALPGLEADEIASLLGLKPATEVVVADSSSVPVPPIADQPVSLPLVFKDVDLTALNPTPEQIQVIEEARKNFMKDIGGANQDPGDPAYLERWQKALPAADDMLRGMLGVSFFENYQLAVVGN